MSEHDDGGALLHMGQGDYSKNKLSLLNQQKSNRRFEPGFEPQDPRSALLDQARHVRPARREIPGKPERQAGSSHPG